MLCGIHPKKQQESLTAENMVPTNTPLWMSGLLWAGGKQNQQVQKEAVQNFPYLTKNRKF